MSEKLYDPRVMNGNPRWHAEDFQKSDPTLVTLRRRCENSYPKTRETSELFVARNLQLATTRPSYQAVYTWGYSYFLSLFFGFRKYGNNPVSLAMSSHWSKGNTEFIRLRFLLEADNGTTGSYKQSDIVRLGERLLQKFPGDIMIRGELLNAYKRDNRLANDGSFQQVLADLIRRDQGSFESLRYQLSTYSWFWQSSREPRFADASLNLINRLLEKYPSRLFTPKYYQELAQVIRKKRNNREPILWPNPPKLP